MTCRACEADAYLRLMRVRYPRYGFYAPEHISHNCIDSDVFEHRFEHFDRVCQGLPRSLNSEQRRAVHAYLCAGRGRVPSASLCAVARAALDTWMCRTSRKRKRDGVEAEAEAAETDPRPNARAEAEDAGEGEHNCECHARCLQALERGLAMRVGRDCAAGILGFVLS
jgi:hypothetical protein